MCSIIRDGDGATLRPPSGGPSGGAASADPGQDWPTPRERQVLAYHQKYGTTSPLYEEIRAKYPDW